MVYVNKMHGYTIKLNNGLFLCETANGMGWNDTPFSASIIGEENEQFGLDYVNKLNTEYDHPPEIEASLVKVVRYIMVDVEDEKQDKE